MCACLLACIWSGESCCFFQILQMIDFNKGWDELVIRGEAKLVHITKCICLAIEVFSLFFYENQ